MHTQLSCFFCSFLLLFHFDLISSDEHNFVQDFYGLIDITIHFMNSLIYNRRNVGNDAFGLSLAAVAMGVGIGGGFLSQLGLGNFLPIYKFNFYVLNHFLLIYICKFHWNR